MAIPTLTQKQLLTYLKSLGVTPATTLSMKLLEAYMARAMNVDPRSLQLTVEDYTKGYLRDSGVNPDLSPEVYLRFLVEHQVPYQYFFPTYYKNLVGAIIYEHKLPVPLYLWYTVRRYQDIFIMSQPNFVHVYETFVDDTPIEYLMSFEPRDVSGRTAPLFQRESVLRQIFRDVIPDTEENGTSRGALVKMLYRINQNNDISPEQRQAILGIEKAAYDYPNREVYFNRILTGLQDDVRKIRTLSYVFINVDRHDATQQRKRLDLHLSVPPRWWERDYFIIRYGSPAEYTDSTRRLAEIFRRDPDAYTYLDKLIQYTFVDPTFRPSRQEIADIVRANTKAWRRIDPVYLRSIVGWSEDIEMLPNIRSNLDTQEFHVLLNGAACLNPTDLVNETPFAETWAVSYGTFTDFVCWSIDDLNHAFTSANGEIIPRRPDRPNEIFTRRQLTKLYETLNSQDPRFIPNYTQQITPFTQKLLTLLRRPVTNELRSLTEDRNRLVSLFTHLFNAGMYQRTWQGPGHPYPMKYEQTRGCNLNVLAVNMTPELGMLMLDYAALTPAAKDVIDGLKSLSYNEADKQVVETTSELIAFIRQTMNDKACIGFGSAYMIVSAYQYLKDLGVTIPGFDITRFETRSTHR